MSLCGLLVRMLEWQLRGIGFDPHWGSSFFSHKQWYHSKEEFIVFNTDLYLQWDSHHNLAAKYSVINTLTHRAKTVCSSPQLLKEEEDHFRQALINASTLFVLPG